MILSHGMCTLALRDDSGIMRYAIDWLGTPEKPGGGDPAESVQPFGFRSRPRDPELDAEGSPIASLGCGLLFFDDGGESFAWPTQDPRYRLVLPEIAAGSVELYATLAAGTVARLTIDGADGTLTVTTPTGEVVKVKPDGTLEVGGAAAKALAIAEQAEAYCAALKAAVMNATAAGGGATLVFVPAFPLPGTPSFGATKAKSI